MMKKMAVTERPAVIEIDEQPPLVVLVVSRDVYAALEAAVEIAYEDSGDVPLEHREGATELWAAFHD